MAAVVCALRHRNTRNRAAAMLERMEKQNRIFSGFDADAIDRTTAADLAEVGSDKWTRYPGCIGAFIAEMDYGLAPCISRPSTAPATIANSVTFPNRGSAAWPTRPPWLAEKPLRLGRGSGHHPRGAGRVGSVRDLPARAGRRRQCRGRADARVHAVPERAEAVRRRRDRNRNASGNRRNRPAQREVACSISTPSNLAVRGRLPCVRAVQSAQSDRQGAYVGRGAAAVRAGGTVRRAYFQ